MQKVGIIVKNHVLQTRDTLSPKEKIGASNGIFHKVEIKWNLKGLWCFRSEKWKTSSYDVLLQKDVTEVF